MATKSDDVDNIPFATPLQAVEIITDCLGTNKVPMLKGSPGIGKSMIYHQIAKRFKLKLIDIRLSTHDITDLTGYPWPDLDAGKMRFLAPDMFPLVGEPIPEGYEGWLILFDEINSAGDEKQAASYKVILDKMIHQTKLHPRAVMAAAGNLETDNAIVNELSTAMQSRLIHIRMKVDFDGFMSWGGSTGMDHRVLGFMNFKPDQLHSFNPDHDGDTYPCPRTWHFMSDFCHHWGDDEKDLLTPTRQILMNGTVGVGAAHMFGVYLDVYKDMIEFSEIVKNPKAAPLPSKLDVKCAISALIANRADEDTLKPAMEYVNRMPGEFQAVCVKDLVRRKPDYYNHEVILAWRKEHAVEFFA